MSSLPERILTLNRPLVRWLHVWKNCGNCSQGSKMASISGEFTCCVPGGFNNNKHKRNLSFLCPLGRWEADILQRRSDACPGNSSGITVVTTRPNLQKPEKNILLPKIKPEGSITTNLGMNSQMVALAAKGSGTLSTPCLVSLPELTSLCWKINQHVYTAGKGKAQKFCQTFAP